jgi:hypothetical protein
MAKTQKRASLAVSKKAIAHASSALEALPAKPKSNWSLRETISMLQDSITEALNKGYSYPEVSKMLALKGVDISASSLKSYLASAKRGQDTAIAKGKKAVKKAAPKAKAANSKVVSLEAKKAEKQAAKKVASSVTRQKKVAAAKPAAAKKLGQAKASAPVKTVAKAKSTVSARAAVAPKAKAVKKAVKAVAKVAPKAANRDRKKLG